MTNWNRSRPGHAQAHTSFLGLSGAGKSTPQTLLIGLLKGYTGSARVLGREDSAWGAEYYERIGVSFELPNHFLKLSALEKPAYFVAMPWQLGFGILPADWPVKLVWALQASSPGAWLYLPAGLAYQLLILGLLLRKFRRAIYR